MCIKKMKYITICAMALVAMVSCKAPEVTMEERATLPTSGKFGATDTTYVSPLLWDEFFHDSVLRNYIDIALKNNHSFQQTMERISMSRAVLQRAKGMMLPDVNLNLGASVRRYGDYTMDGVGNTTTNTPDLRKDKHIPNPYSDFGLSLNFQWEADIWGKLTRKKQAAAARWMASVEATRFAQSILISDLAIQYYELIGLDRREAVLRFALESARSSYELTLQLKKEGAETQLAVDQFYARVLSLESKLLQNDQMVGEKERAIACLLGVFPFKIERMPFDQIERLDIPLPKGIPANLLTLRPDVREAELELLASKADVVAAKAAFYPSLVLGAGGGFNAFNLNKWFKSPASMVYDLAAGITAPIFRRHEIRSMWNEAKSSQRIALSRYHEVALRAYTEVVDLYCATNTQVERIKIKEQETLSHQRSVENASEMFQLSYIGFLEVLSAHERFLESELEHIDIVTELCRKKILLYRALGGGC